MTTIRCFTNMDSLFDVRRGIITKVALENGYSKFDWETNFAKIYKRRRYDYFNQPELGITQERYEARYEKRTIDDFADENQTFVRPSKLIRRLFGLAREVEFGVGQIIAASGFSLTVNLYPYVMNDNLQKELESVIRGAIPFNFTLSFVNIPYDEVTASVINSFQYVFIYDFLVGKYYKAYWDAYGTMASSSTRFIVPDVLRKTDLPDEMKSEEPIKIIGNYNVTQGGKTTWVPIPKTIFDYVE